MKWNNLLPFGSALFRQHWTLSSSQRRSQTQKARMVLCVMPCIVIHRPQGLRVSSVSRWHTSKSRYYEWPLVIFWHRVRAAFLGVFGVHARERRWMCPTVAYMRGCSEKFLLEGCCTRYHQSDQGCNNAVKCLFLRYPFSGEPWIGAFSAWDFLQHQHICPSYRSQWRINFTSGHS